jgi:hypothetical protein
MILKVETPAPMSALQMRLSRAQSCASSNQAAQATQSQTNQTDPLDAESPSMFDRMPFQRRGLRNLLGI